MEREILNESDVAQILNSAELIKRARIFEGKSQRPFSVQIVQLDLSTAKLETDPYPIRFPFRSFYIQSATDTYANIQVKVGSRDTTQSGFTAKQNDSFSADIPQAEAYLYWSAQSGKSMTIVFFTDAEFRSGSQISVSGGGVSINEGTSVSAATRVILSAATAAIIAPTDSTRKTSVIQNNTSGDLFISGTSAVTNSGATRGITLTPGTIYEYRNTGALYGYSVAGGDVTRMDLI